MTTHPTNTTIYPVNSPIVSPTSSSSSGATFKGFRSGRATAGVVHAADPEDPYVDDNIGSVQPARSLDDSSVVARPIGNHAVMGTGTHSRVDASFEVKQEPTSPITLPSFAHIAAHAGLGVPSFHAHVGHSPIQDLRQRIERVEARQWSLGTALSGQENHQVWMQEKSSALHTDIESIEERLATLEARFEESEERGKEVWMMVRETQITMNEMWDSFKHRMERSKRKRENEEPAVAQANDPIGIQQVQEEASDTKRRAKRRRGSPRIEPFSTKRHQTRSQATRKPTGTP